MKKELIYLSFPDFFNKNLFCNYNQKLLLSDYLNIKFNLLNSYHLGSAIKSIYLLEIIFPMKPFVLKIKLKKKKLKFGQKRSNKISYYFSTSINILDFLDHFRFFIDVPFNTKNNKTKKYFVTNARLNQFNFNKNIFFFNEKTNNSLNNLLNYHLN